MTKECIYCNTVKSKLRFRKSQRTFNGYLDYCKDCSKEARMSNNSMANRGRIGVVSSMYSNQRRNSYKRNHPLPEYSQEELYSYVVNHPRFNRIYRDWINSDYDTNLKPSIDRKDDDIHYTMENIELKTWGENNAKGHSDTMKGINNKRSYPILQYKENELIGEYYSIAEAKRQTGINGIASSATTGHTAGGYSWFHKEPTVSRTKIGSEFIYTIFIRPDTSMKYSGRKITSMLCEATKEDILKYERRKENKE